MIHEYIETIQFEAVDLEFYELAHNCKILKEKNKSNNQIK